MLLVGQICKFVNVGQSFFIFQMSTFRLLNAIFCLKFLGPVIAQIYIIMAANEKKLYDF